MVIDGVSKVKIRKYKLMALISDHRRSESTLFNTERYVLWPIERPLRRFNLPIDICPKYFAQFYFAHLDICSNEICSKWRRHLPMKTLAQFHVSNYLCLALTFNYLLNGNTVGMVLHKQLQNISITGFSYDLPSNPWIFQPKSMLDVGI